MDKSTPRKPRYLDEVSQHNQVSRPSSVPVSTAETVHSLEKKVDPIHGDRDIDKEYLIRALSHDIGAHLMILEYSFRHYDEQARKLAAELKSSPVRETTPEVSQSSIDKYFLRQDKAGTSTHPPHADGIFHTANESAFQTSDLPPETPTSVQIVLNEAASHVTACIDEMKRFVQELISFAKTGNIDMEPTAIQLEKIVDEVFFEQQHLIEKRKIQVVVSSPLPTVCANPVRVKQMLTNLIRNAAIHGCDSEHPMIMIASEFVPNTELVRDAMVCFSIRDNGRGIPQSFLKKIFEPGYRVPGNQNEGSGIGLATVKKIANYYSGDVVCESHEGGTVFFVTLPKG